VRTLRLPAPGRWLRIEAVVQLTRASVELRLLPSPRIARLHGAQQPVRADEHVPGDRSVEAARIGRTVAGVSRRLPWHPTCLRQALAARRMLRRRGIACTLHLGVANASLIEAHAWVTVDGEPVVGRPGLERFVPLVAFE
jgi:hypothetical protein